MSLKTIEFDEFADFRLDRSQKVLLRDGKPIPLTPKVYDTLEILVENSGRLLEKDELMQKLWQDRFVEESNLTSNIKTLRKALGDDALHPQFIETVPRRGYRFIADVRERVNENGSAGGSSKETIHSPRFKNLVPAAAIFIIAVIGSSLWYARNGNVDDEAPILLAEFRSEKLSTDGTVRSAVISPDGKNVFYVNGVNGKPSVWIRQLESSNNVQIIPPSDTFYYELALSPAGDILYFARVQRGLPERQKADIYRVSVFGGVPEKIVSGTEGSVSVSADGRRISFRRCPYLEGEYCSLWIADSDGRNEKRLLSRPYPIRIGDNVISPDGKTIAFAVGQSRNGANEFSLAEFDLENGVEREVAPEKFFDIKHLAWLPNQRGILLTAKKFPENNFRIWHVSAATGEANALTNDSDDYGAMSLSKDAGVLVSTKSRADFRLNIYQPDGPSGLPSVLADAGTVGFAPDGKILFSSAMTGNSEIWSINADGSEQRQLTNNPALDLFGVVSRDNKFVFFDSNRTGESQVWRMNTDGSNQFQITRKGGGYPQLVSPDGNWLYYLSQTHRKLMRVPIDGGEEELVLDEGIDHFALSPDASRVAFAEWRNKRTIKIISLADKQTIKTYYIPNERAGIVQFAWSSDGKSLYYVSLDDRSENYMIWQQPLNGRMPIWIADLGPYELRETRAFAISPDERSFAVIRGSWKADAILIKGLR